MSRLPIPHFINQIKTKLGFDRTLTASGEDVVDAVNKQSQQLANIADLVYPIGAIYMSVILVTPDTLFGGTWERLKDKFLLAAGDTYEAGKTGGAATHTLTTSEMPSHNHVFSGTATNTGIQSAGHTHNYTDYYATTTGNTAITVAQMASHNHGGSTSKNSAYNTTAIYEAGGDVDLYAINWNGKLIGNDASYKDRTDHSHTISSNGSDNNHNHTGANTSTTRTSQGISANHTHSVTASGTISSTGGGNAFSIMPPYLSVYMWKRVA